MQLYSPSAPKYPSEVVFTMGCHGQHQFQNVGINHKKIIERINLLKNQQSNYTWAQRAELHVWSCMCTLMLGGMRLACPECEQHVAHTFPEVSRQGSVSGKPGTRKGLEHHIDQQSWTPNREEHRQETTNVYIFSLFTHLYLYFSPL